MTVIFPHVQTDTNVFHPSEILGQMEISSPHTPALKCELSLHTVGKGSAQVLGKHMGYGPGGD